MSTSQNLKNQGNLSQGRDSSSPNRYPGPQQSTSPLIPKPGQSIRVTPPPQTRSNPNYSLPPAHSPLIEGNKSAAIREVKGIISDPEDDNYRSRTNTEEEGEPGSRNEIIGHERESDYDHRSEGTENEGQTPKNLVSLSESLKAMKSLRSNFQSFEYEIEAQQRKQGEKVYREVDEEDYVNVMSAEEDHIEEEHEEEEHEEEEEPEEREEEEEDQEEYIHEEPERGSANARREIRGHYIEEIHEELHEESPRKELKTEENEEDVRSRDEIKESEQEEEQRQEELENKEEEFEDQENKEKKTEESEIVAKEEPRHELEEEKSPEEEENKIEEGQREEENKGEEKQEKDSEKEEDMDVKKEEVQERPTSENKIEDTENQGWGITEIDPEESLQAPPQTLPVTKDPEEAIIESKTEDIPAPPKISTENIKQTIPESHPPVSSASRVEEEKRRFLDELEYGDVKPNEPVKEEVPEITPPKAEEEPPKKVENIELPPSKPQEETQDELPPRKIENVELPPKAHQEELPPKRIEDVELPPKAHQEEMPPKKIENIELLPPKIQEEAPPKIIENIELPPPKIVSESRETGHRDQGAKLATAMRSKEREIVQKPKPMFIPAATPFQAKVQEKVQEKIPAPILEPEGPEDPSLIVRFKKMEIELKKEKKKNEHLEEEKETVLSENRNLKQELEELRAKLEAQNQNQPSEELAQKEQETVEKLRLELKNTIESSRLINEHSNKIINESVRYKQEIETIINSLEEEKKQLQQTIIELKNQAHEQNSKVESFQQKSEFFERKASEYEESFDLIQKQIKERTETVQKLTSLHDNAQTALQSIPKIEDLLQKLQPECQSVAVQTTYVQISASPSQSPITKGTSPALDLTTSNFTIQPKTVVPPVKEESPAKPEVFKPKTGPLTFGKKVEAEKPKEIPSSQKEKALVFNLDQEIKTPQKSEEPPKATKIDKPAKEEPKQARVSQDIDDLSLLLGTETVVGKVSAPQVITKTSKEPLKIGGQLSKPQKSAEIKPAIIQQKEPEQVKEKEKPLRESTENKSLFESNIKPSTKEIPQPSSVNVSQDLKSSWGVEEIEIEESKDKEDKKPKPEIKVEEPVVVEKPVKTGLKLQTPKEEEPKVTPKAEEPVVKKPALNLPQGKSMIPNFNKPVITKEGEKKPVGLILPKANTESEKSGPIPNLGGTSNKAGARYSQTNKGFGQNAISNDADNFFDELGVSESPGVRGSTQFKSGSLLRESTASLKSATSQKGQDILGQSAAKKKPLIINQFK